jgi:hypothetical protein
MKPHLNKKSWAGQHEPVIPATVGSINRRTAVQARVGKIKKQGPFLKTNHSKKGWRPSSSGKALA